MRWFLLTALCGASCLESGRTPADAGAPEVDLPKLTLAQVEARLTQPGTFLYDANPKDFFAHGHLPGAQWVKFNELQPDVLPSDRGATLIFYCANELCTASHTAARLAVRAGYSHVFLMPEGFIGWKKSGRPVVRPDQDPVTAPREPTDSAPVAPAAATRRASGSP